MRAREEAARVEADLRDELTGELLPSFLVPTMAFKVQAIAKKIAAPELTAEEVAAMEAEKIEQVSKIRRKFKEQQKLLLQQLSEKNEQKRAQEAAAAMKKMYKPVLPKVHPEPVSVKPQHSDDIDIGCAIEANDGPATFAVGSGLAAVRSSSQHSERNVAESDIALKLQRKAQKLEKKKAKLEKKLIEAIVRESMEQDNLPDMDVPDKGPFPPTAPKKHKHAEHKSSDKVKDVSEEVKEPKRIVRKIPVEEVEVSVGEVNPAVNVPARANTLNQNKLTEYLKEIGDARKSEELEKQKKEVRIHIILQLLYFLSKLFIVCRNG